MKIRLKNIIPFHFAVWTIIFLNILVIGFHLLVLARIIPFEIVWAGTLETAKEMYLFESLSILINCLLIIIVLIKGGLINTVIPLKIVNISLWIFVVLFALNTLGNLTSKTTLETVLATPLTLILAILCWRLAIQ